MRPIDVNISAWDNGLEELSGKYHAVRLGFRNIKGMREDDAYRLVAMRGDGYHSFQQLRDAGISDAALERLADADAYRSMGLDRRQALWHATTKDYQPNAVFSDEQLHPTAADHVDLPPMLLSEHVVQDYASISFSLKQHPVSFIRKDLDALRTVTTATLASMDNGDPVKVAGLILVRQRPGTASGICFMTIEDETGIANLVVFPKLFDLYRKQIIKSKLIQVEGKVQKQGDVIHVIVNKCMDISRLLGKLTVGSDEVDVAPKSRADETTSPAPKQIARGAAVVQGNIFPEARNFR